MQLKFFTFFTLWVLGIMCIRGLSNFTTSHFGWTAPLKGKCYEMDISFKGIKFSSFSFCLCADGFQDLSEAFH
jgi:hypothetical protein